MFENREYALGVLFLDWNTVLGAEVHEASMLGWVLIVSSSINKDGDAFDREVGTSTVRLRPPVATGAVQRFVGDVPDIGQTDAGVEMVEKLEWKEGVQEEQPRHGAEEGYLGVLERDGLGLHRPEDPSGDVSEDEEGEKTSPGHVGDVLLLRRIPSHPVQDLDHLESNKSNPIMHMC